MIPFPYMMPGMAPGMGPGTMSPQQQQAMWQQQMQNMQSMVSTDLYSSSSCVLREPLLTVIDDLLLADDVPTANDANATNGSWYGHEQYEHEYE